MTNLLKNFNKTTWHHDGYFANKNVNVSANLILYWPGASHDFSSIHLMHLVLMKNLLSKGGTLIFSYIRRLGLLFWIKNFEFNIVLCFPKNEYFGGMNNLSICFEGSSQNWTMFRHRPLTLYFSCKNANLLT